VAPPRQLLRAILVLAAAATLTAGCASTRRGVRARTDGGLPWIVPREEEGSQRIYRVRVESAEGRGRFRLLLRLDDLSRYQIRATHPLFNRRLWSLDVDDVDAVLVDHAQHAVCRYRDQAEIDAIPLGPFPFASLPALLLGYLPLPPAREPVLPGPGGVSYVDSMGRRWSAVLDGGTVRSWQVSGDDIGTVSWELRDDWSVLGAADEELDLRWRETLRERASGPLLPLDVPADYTVGVDCDLGWLRAVEDAPWEEETTER
jgi:hypothetical protein